MGRMKSTMHVGIERDAVYAVTADMSPPHLPVAVLSTPAMVQLIEATCMAAAQDHLDDGETTVGTHICVSHHAPAMEGEQVDVHCRLGDVRDRALHFEVQVRGANGVLSQGTHERRVVDTSRFG